MVGVLLINSKFVHSSNGGCSSQKVFISILEWNILFSIKMSVVTTLDISFSDVKVKQLF